METIDEDDWEVITETIDEDSWEAMFSQAGFLTHDQDEEPTDATIPKLVKLNDKKMPNHLMALAFCRLDANRDLELDHQELKTFIEFCCPLAGTLNIEDWHNLIFEPIRTGLNLSDKQGEKERSLTLQQFEKLIMGTQNLRAIASKNKVHSAEFRIAQMSLNMLSLPEGRGRKTIRDFLDSPRKK